MPRADLEPRRLALASSGLIDGLEERADELLTQAEEIHLPGGQIVFSEGDEADALYVVLEGAVQVVGVGRDGRELVLRRLGPVSSFGEQAILPVAGRRTAGVRTAEPTVLLRLARDDFRRVIGREESTQLRLAELGERNARQQLLRHSHLLGAFDSAVAARERTIAAGEVLFSEGDEADSVYLIVRGTAAVYREQGGRPVLLGRVQEGRCVGELAFVRRARRGATVIAETELRVFEVEGTRFAELLESSPELRDHVRALERVYQLPARGFITQHSGRVLGADAVTTVFHLARGRRFAASRLVSQEIYHLERLEPPPPTDAVVLRHGGVELRMAETGEIVGITAQGGWRDLESAHLRAIDGVALSDDERALFEASGELLAAAGEEAAVEDDPDRVLCTCLHVVQRTVDQAIREGCSTVESLQRSLSCGTVCGGCIPRLAERLGEVVWTPVEISDEIHLTPDVRAFRLRPLSGRLHPWRAGQHIVISALIDGLWIERQYTLSAAPGADAYEITVKREPLGLFSRWLFDERGPDAQIRVSRPQGDTLWEPGEAPMLCFVAGIGVTPAIAACRTLVAGGGRGAVHVDYSGRTCEDLAYLEEMRAAEGAGLTLVVRETSTQGRLVAEDIAQLVALHPAAEAYVCGPAPYLLDVTAHLRAAGVPGERVHVEVFTHAGSPVTTEEADAALTTADAKYLFSAPRPATVSPWARALLSAGRATYLLANNRLNPARPMSDRIAAQAGLDPALPRVHLGAVGALALGPRESHVEPTLRFHAAYAGNRRRAVAALERGEAVDARTPDGNSWGYWLPNAPLVPFEGPLAVQTGWTKATEDGWFVPVVVTKSPHAIAHLMGGSDVADRGPLPYHYLAQLIGTPGVAPEPTRMPTGLFAGRFRDNETWDRDRRLATSVFGPTTLTHLLPAMETSLTAVLAQIDAWLDDHPNEVIDGHDLMIRIAYDMVIRSSFGNADIEELHEIGDLLRPPLRAALEALWATMNGRRSQVADLTEQVGEMKAVLNRLIAIVRQRHAEGRLGAAQMESPIVRLIVEGDERGPLSEDRLHTLLGPIIVAGHETTGHTLAWALYQLARNPGLRSLVVDEIDLFRRTHRGRTIIPAHYDERPWTQALLYEVWRRYPPIPGIARFTHVDGEIPPDPQTGIGSFSFRRDTFVIGSIIGVQMDPDRYAQPFEFRPERFMTGVSAGMSLRERGRQVRENEAQLEETCQLLTFGNGPGRCLGRAFNLLESFVVLDGLLSRFDIALADPHAEVPVSMAALAGPEAGHIGIVVRRRGGAL